MRTSSSESEPDMPPVLWNDRVRTIRSIAHTHARLWCGLRFARLWRSVVTDNSHKRRPCFFSALLWTTTRRPTPYPLLKVSLVTEPKHRKSACHRRSCRGGCWPKCTPVMPKARRRRHMKSCFWKLTLSSVLPDNLYDNDATHAVTE